MPYVSFASKSERSLVQKPGCVVLIVVALALISPASAAAKALRGTVGPGFTINLVDESGARVTQLDAGTHTITVEDLSNEHNFHLSGPGVNMSTDVDFVGTVTWTVTIQNGRYAYACDPHASQMQGSFIGGTGPANPPPSPPPAAAKGAQLVGTVGPGFSISLKTSKGKAVKTLKAGRYRISIRDRSAIHNFHLAGTGVNKKTAVSFQGTTVWTVTFKKGKVYRFICDPHRSSMKGSFRVT
jgi:plastocyanin